MGGNGNACCDDTSKSTSYKEEKNIFGCDCWCGEKEHVGPVHIGVCRKGWTCEAHMFVPGQILILFWSEDHVIGDKDGCRRKQPICKARENPRRRKGEGGQSLPYISTPPLLIANPTLIILHIH